MSLFEAKSKFFVSSNIPANCPKSKKKLLIFKKKKKKKKKPEIKHQDFFIRQKI